MDHDAAVNDMLRGSQIQKRFGDYRALCDIDIELSPGSISVVIGPSGAGKTTLLRALAMIEPPDSGIIGVDDDVWRFPGDYRPPWPKVTVVFQQFFLWPHMSVRANIEFPLRFTAGLARTELDHLIDLFELRPLLQRLPAELSLGQQQRVALLRALAVVPRYLLLDEITSALDVEQSAKILKHLVDLKSTGLAVLAVTHHLGFARNVADAFYFIDRGEILESGSPAFLESPRTERLRRFISHLDFFARNGQAEEKK